MTRGRKPTPTAVHRLAGTYRPDRHGKRSDDIPATRPIKPRDIPKDAAKLWDALVPWLVQHGAVQAIDRTALELLCRLWALARASLAAAEATPLDKDARIAAVAYAARFESLAARFGLTPVDRARLVLNPPEVEQPKTRFFKVV